MYKFYNANALQKHTNDCVIRAISKAEGKSWDETYDELSDLAQKDGIILDDVTFVEDYLDKRYTRVPHSSKFVGELCDEYPIGTYLVTMQGHITVLQDNYIVDTFDCRPRRIWGVWKVPQVKRGK